MERSKGAEEKKTNKKVEQSTALDKLSSLSSSTVRNNVNDLIFSLFFLFEKRLSASYLIYA